MDKEEIIKTLSKYNISENDIIGDFKEYCFSNRINYKYSISYQNVNDYIMYCYYEIFDNLDNYSNGVDSMILKDEILSLIEIIIYDNFNIDTEG